MVFSFGFHFPATRSLNLLHQILKHPHAAAEAAMSRRFDFPRFPAPPPGGHGREGGRRQRFVGVPTTRIATWCAVYDVAAANSRDQLTQPDRSFADRRSRAARPRPRSLNKIFFFRCWVLGWSELGEILDYLAG